MSRVGLKPVPIPPGVEVHLLGEKVRVKGPLGELERSLPPEMKVAREGETLTVARPSDRREHRAQHGLTRSLLANMVAGVTQGFRKELELSGVGYRAALAGEKLVLQVGYSHSVEVSPLPEVRLSLASPTRIIVQGPDKEVVGEVAARIHRVRPVEPYKGKGIAYLGERVRRKAGKAGKTGARK